MKKIMMCITACIVSYGCSFANNVAYAMTFTNDTSSDVVINMYSGGAKCFESHPIAKGAVYERPSPPRKCKSPVYKIKAESGKKVCRMADLSWEAQIVFSTQDRKLVCSEFKAGGH